MPNKKSINDEKKDIFGRNLSYLLSCTSDIKNLKKSMFILMILKVGYTPLHLLLRDGHLQKAFKIYKIWKDEKEFLSHKYGGHVFNQLDHDGLTPFELYGLELQSKISRFPNYINYEYDDILDSIKPHISWQNNEKFSSLEIKLALFELPLDMHSQRELIQSGGTHILSYGSNFNYQLGTGNKDDRQQLFQLDIECLDRQGEFLSQTKTFSRIKLTRYHSIIVTSDNKIYTCGNNSRGRLGNGSIDTSQPNYLEILDLEESNFQQLSSSDHHTLVLDENGSVYSWGWNAYGQLGYNTGSNKTVKDDFPTNAFSAVPKKISFLDFQDIKFISCSKIHSCAVSKNGTIYLWGLNVGQLGVSKPLHLSPDTEHVGAPGFITRTPVRISLPNIKIEQVLCTEFATFIRASGNILYVYSNYSTKRFKIPLPRAKNFKPRNEFAHFTPVHIPHKVTDMKCQNTYGNNLCFKYECGRIGIINVKAESPAMWSNFKNTLPVSLYWTPNYKFKRCLNFDVGQFGSLILCTLGGSVLTSQGIGKPFEKVFSNKLISGRAVDVSCDSVFGSFSILKSESNSIPILYPKDSINFSFSKYSPLFGITDRGFDLYGPLTFNIIGHKEYLTNKNAIFYPEEEEDSKVALIPKFENEGYRFDATNSLVSQIVNNKSSTFNVIFRSESNEIICSCHQFILSARCKNLVKILKSKGIFTTNDNSLELNFQCSDNDNHWEIVIQNRTEWIANRMFKEFVHFLYTDEKPMGKSWKLLLMLTDDSIHMSKLSHAIRSTYPLENTSSNITSILPDVIIYSKNGHVVAHSFILLSRSQFFSIKLSPPWIKLSKDGMKMIHLEHIEGATKENIQSIVKFLYGFQMNEILEDLKFESTSEIVHYLMALLALSDEFNLEYLKNILECNLDKFINGSTVITIFMNSVFAHSKLLSMNCCFFILTNIGLLFSRTNIELIDKGFSDKAWNLLEKYLITLKNGLTIKNYNQYSPWYNQPNTDWVNLFCSNLKVFNERFIGKDSNFIQVGTESSESRKGSTSRRRSSLLHTSRPSSKDTDNSSSRRSSHTIQDISSGKEIWKQQYTLSGNSNNGLFDDSHDFIEVTKRTRRRYSDRLPPDLKAPQLINIPGKDNSEVLIHSTVEESNRNLPSLLNTKYDTIKNTDIKQPEEGNSKTKVSNFKKLTQKERIKQRQAVEETLIKMKSQEEQSKNKPVWGNSKANHTNRQVSNSRKNVLPSLYDAESLHSIRDSSPVTNTEPIRLSAATIVAKNIPLVERTIKHSSKNLAEDNLNAKVDSINEKEQKLEQQQEVINHDNKNTVSKIINHTNDKKKYKKEKIQGNYKPSNSPPSSKDGNSNNSPDSSKGNKTSRSVSDKNTAKHKEGSFEKKNNIGKKNKSSNKPKIKETLKKELPDKNSNDNSRNGNIVHVHKPSNQQKDDIDPAKEFEKWFALESARIQQQMDQRDHSISNELEAIYSSSQALPDFLIQEEQHRKTKNLKQSSLERNIATITKYTYLI
ncbi:hypothetical protein TBLA_0D00810 [Henningerozyma blattae CBS 6284]|uniref:BTB domain-containing protein n=1 Tax=Henningerozyma blattae (strain ATCC 34711 / CBS 6284 / DSM 70876 / NBRC 10599 / NRRL Y-10934 / UCD 77-7) TaxID=1071380 RepID=I2H2I7_HENB6|nr:hypothetical protein TBLA_0D00810 [Tetrapisispora blattae CBS 6284]CCH60589.1 hypothetical protein TBLA_0D00810 [Tetrapisispora blattae CBS 6284]